MSKLSVLFVALFFVGCATAPPDLFVVSPDQLQNRQLETRRYDGIKEGDLIAANASVLQDLGFNLENSETRLGVLTASKQRDATDGWEIAGKVLISLFFRISVPYGKDQTIRVALVIRPVNDSEGNAIAGSHFVRVTFQRLVRRSDNSVVAETVREPELYQEFFERVSKSVFLEAQKV